MHSNKFNQKWDQFNKMLRSARICWDLMGSDCISAIFRSFRIQCACVISIKCWDLYAQVPYSDPVTFRCVCVISIKWWDLDGQVQYSDPGHSDVFVLSECKNRLDQFKLLKMYRILVIAENGKC